MTKDLMIPENIKDPKYREYFDHLHEIIDKQNKEIFVKNQLFQILNLNFAQGLDSLAGELLVLLWNDQFNSIRIIIKNHEGQKGELLYSGGIGDKNDSYSYLDDQIEDQLGEPGILYIPDTSKIHSIKFVPGVDFPKTILGISLGHEKENHGFVWFACVNQKNFTKHESDTLLSLIKACSAAIQNCVEWNEKTKALFFRSEVLDQVDYPILIFNQNEVIFSNLSAKKSFNQILDNFAERQLLLKNFWKLPFEKISSVKLNNRDFKVSLIEGDHTSSKKIQAAIFIDETFLKKQQSYLSLILNSISQGLRSALNLILGSIKMLPLVGEINEHQKDFIKAVQLKAEESLNVIDDLLEIERLIKGDGLKLNNELLKSLVDISISMVGHIAKQKQISLINVIPDSDVSYYLDKVLFTQILANIFEFAIGQTNINGEITIKAEKDSHGLRILIIDNSNGLSKVEVERLNSSERLNEIPPTLRLARKISEFHCATLILQSDLGKGNTYIVQMPINFAGDQLT